MDREDVTCRELYGGAMTAMIPSRFLDVSEHQEVPDFQESFVDPDVDQSLLFDVLEMQPDWVEPRVFALQHWMEIIECAQGEVVGGDVESRQLTPTMGLAVGRACISKNAQFTAANTVRVVIAVIRFPHVQTDFVVSLYANESVHPESSVAQHADPIKIAAVTLPACVSLLTDIANSVSVVDWSVFG
eukprot:ANDGO_08092.mRNA.1 putative ran guanine nucleotide release factor